MTEPLLPIAAMAVGISVMLYGGWRSTADAESVVHDLRGLERRHALVAEADPAARPLVITLLRHSVAGPLDAAEATVLGRALACAEEPSCDLPPVLREAVAYQEATLSSVLEEVQRTRTRSQAILVAGGVLAVIGLAQQAWRLARRLRAVKARERALGAVDRLLHQRLEEVYQLRMSAAEAQRFAAYGELAAGFSHRLKTPLAGVRLAAQLARRKMGDDHPALAQLTDIVEATDKLLDEVRRFLTATRTGALLRARVQLAVLVEGIAKEYAEQAAASELVVQSSTAPALPEILVDAALLEMAFRNLLENALAAAPPRSTLTITTGPAEPPPRAGLDESAPLGGEWVEVVVSDEGPGISPHILDGSPGSTTKPLGTGMGLAISRRIAARHGGALLIETSQKGTSVRLVLPCAEAA